MRHGISVFGTEFSSCPMTRNVFKAGHRATVWYRTPARAELLENEGAAPDIRVGGAAEACDATAKERTAVARAVHWDLTGTTKNDPGHFVELKHRNGLRT